MNVGRASGRSSAAIEGSGVGAALEADALAAVGATTAQPASARPKPKSAIRRIAPLCHLGQGVKPAR